MDFSRRTRNSKAQDKTPLQQLHDQASELLTKKNEQISKLNDELEAAERKLADLKYQYKAQHEAIKEDSQIEAIDDDAITPEQMKELEELKAKNDSELQKLLAANEEEVNQLEETYQKQLKEAENWAEQHADQILIEKQQEHRQLQNELESLKAKLADTEFMTTRTKFQLLEESRTTSMSNDQKIRYLESQLSDLSSLMRDEIRAIRGKIEQTVASYDARTREHQIEVDRYENEINARNEKYESHIEALQQQYDREIAKYETAINTSERKYNQMQKIMKQLEKQHEKQVSVAIKDNEKIRTTIYTLRTKDNPDLEFTRTIMSMSALKEQQIQQMENDLKYDDEEIKELMMENKDLEQQIAKFNRLAEQSKKPGSKY